MKTLSIVLALICLPLAGCSLFGYTKKVKVNHPLVTLENGIEYQEIIVGEGPAVLMGQKVTIDYVGYLSDGSIFDSSRQRGVPIGFELGDAPLGGWNDGIVGMQASGQRHLSLPPELAYGAAGIEGMIPPNETLVFEISLLSIDD